MFYIYVNAYACTSIHTYIYIYVSQSVRIHHFKPRIENELILRMTTSISLHTQIAEYIRLSIYVYKITHMYMYENKQVCVIGAACKCMCQDQV